MLSSLRLDLASSTTALILVTSARPPCLSSHKSILDYLYNSGLSASYDALRSETHHDDFDPDPKSKHAGLLEKKWTSVIRLQKKVSTTLSIPSDEHWLCMRVRGT